MYLAEADKNDTMMTDKLKGDTDGILIFTGLFAATVAAFIVEFYKKLNPDSGDDAVTLLSGISQQVAALSTGAEAPPSSSGTFLAPDSAVRVNALWFTSLFLSLSVALSSTLVQQWSRRYLRAVRRRGPPHKRGPVHVILHEGMKKFRIEQAVEVVIALLHLSVFFFLTGLMEFLFEINASVAHACLPFFAAGGIIYLVLTFLPFFFPSSPYDTPLTHVVRLGVASFAILLWAVLSSLQYIQKHALLRLSRVPPVKESAKFSRMLSGFHPKKFALRICRTRKQVLKDFSKHPSSHGAQYALRFTLKMLDERWEVAELIAGLPDFLGSMTSTNAADVVVHLFQHELLMRRMHEAAIFHRSRSPAGIHHILGTCKDMLVRVMQSPQSLRSLASTEHEHGLLLDLARMMNWRRKYPSTSALIVCEIAQLRDALTSAFPASTRRVAGHGFPDSSCSYALLILMSTSFVSDPVSRHKEFLRIQNSAFPVEELRQWSSAEGSQRLIGRVGHLDNITCFARRIWSCIYDKSRSPHLMFTEHHDTIVDTTKMLVRSFCSAPMASRSENAVWSTVVLDFEDMWSMIGHDVQGSRNRDETSEEAEILVELHNLLQSVAETVLRQPGPDSGNQCPDESPRGGAGDDGKNIVGGSVGAAIADRCVDDDQESNTIIENNGTDISDISTTAPTEHIRDAGARRLASVLSDVLEDVPRTSDDHPEAPNVHTDTEGAHGAHGVPCSPANAVQEDGHHACNCAAYDGDKGGPRPRRKGMEELTVVVVAPR
ncbi:hypothetical protein OF83DRAFT_1095949 [Amylostereum chailletii]|nr:hypothetical protein OF83DRAFT_1095949 [Amylostereum chailletii]